MKTTLDIADHLLIRAKEVARQENSTLRELTEEGLELALKAREQRGSTKIEPVTFAGGGLTPEFQGASWSQIRDAAYDAL